MAKTDGMLREAIERVVTDMSPEQLHELMAALPEDYAAMSQAFCEHFGFGNWFTNALEQGDLNIYNELLRIVTEIERNREVILQELAVSHDADIR